MTLLKSIVACLVLANIGYFLWSRGVAQPAGTPPASAPSAGLRLASESPEASQAAGGAGATDGVGGIAGGNGGRDTARADAADGARKRCIAVGPFRDVSEAARAATTLRDGGYDPRQRVADGEVWAGVWVYLPLPVLHAAADQILAKLKAGGFEDALEMPGPNDSPVISLGLYGEPKRAQARVAQAQTLGFNPAIADRKRSGNVYWIDIDLKPTDSSLNPADLQGETGHIVRLEVKSCPSASAASP